MCFGRLWFTPLAPSGQLRSKKFQKTLILAFEANNALSRENETKIVKITHSAQSYKLQCSQNLQKTVTGRQKCIIWQVKLKKNILARHLLNTEY